MDPVTYRWPIGLAVECGRAQIHFLPSDGESDSGAPVRRVGRLVHAFDTATVVGELLA